jgi:dipeptidyl aminopeptidase/acylaminoacyl peptidase
VKAAVLAACFSAALAAPALGATHKRAMTLDDVHKLREVSAPALSPDGRWLLYTVTRSDLAWDASVSEVWRVPTDGGAERRLTPGEGKASSWAAQYSPDGKWIAFLSDRGDDETTQVWRMPSDGGEPEALTRFEGGVSEFDWAPDSRRLALVAMDAPDAPAKLPDGEDGPAKPIVTTRLQFKDDTTGYLDDKRSHVYSFDIASKQATLLTPGQHDEWSAKFSPDGTRIAYATRRGADPDRSLDTDLYLVEARAGAQERQLTHYAGADLDPDWESQLSWSPDGSRIAYLRAGEEKWVYYTPWQLAVVDVATGEERVPADLDRSMGRPKWSADGRSVYVLLEQSRVTWLSRIDLADGKLTQLTRGSRFDYDFDTRGGRTVVLTGDTATPNELYALRGDALVPLTRQNSELRAQVDFQGGEDLSVTTKDGTRVDALLLKPVGYRDGTRVPTIVRVHGGPVYQFSHEFLAEWQWYAAQGYAVLGVNPRGGSGRGFEYAKAIFADWGNVDSGDVLAAVDEAVRVGVADPQRLGLGGWSYGGILTDQILVRDARFRAAWSGAGSANALGLYGLDMYIREVELELGKPWLAPEAYNRVSQPFLHADRIRTPTQFLCAAADNNVPCAGGEQMYQSLRSLGVPTRLIVYPDEHHGLTVPSHIAHRLRAYTEWFDRYLK